MGQIAPDPVQKEVNHTSSSGRTHTISNKSAGDATPHQRWHNPNHKRLHLGPRHPPKNSSRIPTQTTEQSLNVLDIRTQNKAIELVWLKDYLNLTPSRQMWARVTDILINATAPPGMSVVAVVNTFLQKWSPPTKGPRVLTMNKNIRRMLSIAKTYETNLTAIRLSPKVRANLPAWYHPGAATRPLTNVKAKCLLKNHTAKSITDLIKTTKKLCIHTNNINHSPAQTCNCIDGIHDRLKGCKNPHACAVEAELCLNDLAPKYNLLAISDGKVRFSSVQSLFCPNHELDHQFGSGIFLNPELNCRFRLKTVRFGFGEGLNTEPNGRILLLVVPDYVIQKTAHNFWAGYHKRLAFGVYVQKALKFHM
jgi:hypothetical protein